MQASVAAVALILYMSDEKYGVQKLGRLNPGDICFTYVSECGIVAVGRVCNHWDRCSYEGENRWIYKECDEEYIEYRIQVDWYCRFVNNPICIKELRHILGLGPRGWSWQSTLGDITEDKAERLLKLAEERMSDIIQSKIKEKTGEIEEKTVGGDYIYRGEPKKHEGCPYYGKVSSSLWRQFMGEQFDTENIDIESVQAATLEDAKSYVLESDKDDFEFMAQLQHYDGKTNLIDFTTDYRIALFFACDGHHDQDGRVVLLQKTEEIKKKYQVEEPQNPQHRVIAQKSTFVRPPKGFIEPGEYKEIIIPKCLKKPMLNHLRKYHGIFTEKIYNDLHGYIKHQNRHQKAYKEFYIGMFYQSRGDSEKAIKHYTKAIKLKPHFAAAYNNRGAVYYRQGDYNHAIDAYTKAIELNPKNAMTYANRGAAYGAKDDHDHTINDCNIAIELDSQNASAYKNRGSAHLFKHDYNHAIEDYTKAIELDPKDAGIYTLRASAYDKIGECDLASKDRERAFKLDFRHVTIEEKNLC